MNHASRCFRRLSLRQRFLVAPLLGLIVCAMITAAFFYGAQRQNDLVSHVTEHDLERFGRFADVFSELIEQHAALYELLQHAAEADEVTLYDASKHQLERIHGSVDALERALPHEHAGASAISTSPHAEVLDRASAYRDAAAAAVAIATTNLTLAPGQLALANERFTAMNRAFVRFLDRERKRITTEVAAKVRDNRIGSMGIALVGIAAAALLFALSMLLARVLTRAIETQVGALIDLGAEAGAQIATGGRDEVDRIAAAIGAFRQTLLDLRGSRDELEQRVAERTQEIRDISDAVEKARRELQGAIEAMDGGFALYDRDDRFVTCNERFHDMHRDLAHLLVAGTPRIEIMRANIRGADNAPTEPAEFEEFVRKQHAAPLGTRDYLNADGTWVRRSARRTADGSLVVTLTDITSLKEAERLIRRAAEERLSEARRETELTQQRLVDAIESINEGFAYFDADNRLVLFNRQYLELYDKSADLIFPGARYEDIVRGGVARGQFDIADGDVEAFVRRALTRHRAPYSEVEVALRDGRWVRVTERATTDGGRVGIRIDITDVKRREAQLVQAKEETERAQQRLIEAIEALPIGFVYFDAEDRFVLSNKRFTEIYLEDAAYFTPGTTFEDIVRNSRAADFDAGTDRFEQSIARRLAQHRNVSGEHLQRLRNGRYIMANERRTSDGGIVGTRTDVTELKQRESALVAANDAAEKARRELQTAIEAINEAFALYDPNDRLVICNSKYQQLHSTFEGVVVPGIARTEVLRLASENARRFPGSRGEASPDPLQFIEEGVGIYDFRMPDGRWLRRSGRRTADGSLVVVMTDITNIKDSEALLRVAKDEAENANRAKSQFLANMSHEIRTPMNGVIGMTEVLDRTSLSDRQKRIVGSIRQSASTLLGVINDILDFSRIEAGRLELDRVGFDVRGAVEDVVELLGEAASAKDIELTCFVADDVPAHAWGDPTRLRQVLLNLIGNAIKFTDQGEVALRITAEQKGHGVVRATFAVRDTGIGIDPDIKSKLFRPFEQADASITRRFGGSGLGLSIAQHIVRAMGGAIEVDSQPGVGSTFRFSVPLEAAPGEPKGGANETGILRGVRALVVDDNATNREILLQHLRGWGIEAMAAEDGPSALRLMERQAAGLAPFTLAILDMMMPGMDGLQLAGAIKADPALARTHLMLLTSLGRHGDHAEAERIGIRATLTKPARRSDIYNAMVNMLAAGRSPSPADPTERTRQSPQRAVRARVLIAEDNQLNQEVATEFLTEIGCTVALATTGAEAVAMYKAERYDIVLMDGQMPIMDGLQATRLIRQHEAANGRPAVPIIAVTAHAFDGDRERCLAAGMSGYLSKPFTFEQLVDAIDRFLPAPTPAAAVPLAAGAEPSPGDVQPPLQPAALAALRAVPKRDGPSLVERVLRMFLDKAPGELQQIRTAIETRDVAAVQLRAHGLKSNAANIGALRLSELFRSLEAAGRDGVLDGAPDIVTEIERELARVTPAINAELAAEAEQRVAS